MLLASFVLFGDDTKVLTDVIDNFKGMADEARKANPLLAAGTGETVKSLTKFVSGRRSGGKTPHEVDLPEAQQEELERRQKARERAEQLAKARPRRVTPPKPAPPSAIAPIPPIVMLAILNPAPKPKYTLVNEADVTTVREGAGRADVIQRLGQPSSLSAIKGLDGGDRELLTYHLSSERTVAIRLVAGRVTSVTRN